jgi:hypothetical protein
VILNKNQKMKNEELFNSYEIIKVLEYREASKTNEYF